MHVLKFNGEPERMVDARERLRAEEDVNTLASTLQNQALEQVGIKKTIEERWLQDLEQYHGRYDQDTESELKEARKSRLFFNMTRTKTNAWEARLSEMLFPTDEENWSIAPTPDPELAHVIERGDNEAAVTEAQAILDAADEAAALMKTKIQDQFIECGYNIECRTSIHDLCKLGTGIMKGPVPTSKRVRKWAQDKMNGGYFVENAAGLTRPGYHRCDPWGQFPDMTARNVDECEFWFERYLMPKKGLLNLGKLPGFDVEQLRKLAIQKPTEGLPDWFTRLRELTNSSQDAPDDNRYHVWEYRGPTEIGQMISICKTTDDFDLLEILVSMNEVEEVDSVIWFCNNTVIKAGVNHMESGDLPYSVSVLERDETSLFGFGVPAMMRHSQKAVNAAWRAMMDNAGITAGPQIVINRDVVQPADGHWRITPNKIWHRKNASTQHQQAFETYDLQNNQQQLGAIVEMARKFIDEETALPLIAQGEQGAMPQQTASGMSMLMNSANVMFRRVVKHWDDHMTIPNVQRIYDWNMQFDTDDKIKGDFEVEAIGSSVLLTRELQTNNLMTLLAQFSAHPVLGPLLKARKGLESLVQSLMLRASDLVKTEEELMADLKAAQENPQPDPETIKIRGQIELLKMKTQAEKDLADIKGQLELQLAGMARDTTMMKLAADQNLTLEKIAADLKKAAATIESSERKFAAETAIKERFGQGI